MFRVATEKDFLDAFRPRDRKHVELPPDLEFPMIIQDYLAWVDPGGARVFLLFTAPGHPHPTGLALRRDQSSGGVSTGRMCEWCHSQGSSDQIGLLSADVNSRKRVGITLCLDLGCGARIEDAADRFGKNSRILARAMVQRMARFTEEALGITASSRE